MDNKAPPPARPARTEVTFPYMRAEVLGSVEALSDPAYQQRVWIDKVYPTVNFYDDLDQNIHILFDDTQVLPDPSDRVGSYLYADEVAPLRELGTVLDAVIDRLGDVSADQYMADPLWADVVALARIALSAMRADTPE